jgi:hypothetical protein
MRMQADRQTERQTETQAERQAERQAETQAELVLLFFRWCRRVLRPLLEEFLERRDRSTELLG